MLMDMKIEKLETEIAQACHVHRRTGQDMGSHTTALEDGCRECLALLPWLQPHLIRQSNHRSTPHEEENKALTSARVNKEGSRSRLEGDLKPHTGGATT